MARPSGKYGAVSGAVSGSKSGLPVAPQLMARLARYNEEDLGPHALALMTELKGAASSGQSLSVIILAAALVDVVQNEEAGPAGYLDGMAFAYAGNKKMLGWLRGRRNGILHHDGPVDGLMGEPDRARWLANDADQAITALLDFLEDLDVSGG